MTMTRQTPGLVLPFVNTVPTTFTYTKGEDKALTLARTLVDLGLGSPELWMRLNGNISRFIRDSISAWLSDIGADEMNNEVDVDLAVFDQLEGYSDSNAPEGTCTPCWIHRTDVALSLLVTSWICWKRTISA
jgi:hypothetical protein